MIYINGGIVFKLMVKTHKTTGLKYLCITKRKNYEEYLGSGVYWKKHLEKYGKLITTEILFETDDYKLFVDKCNHFSIMYDVVSSNEWANIVPETGYNNNDGLPNVVLFWMHADEETKKEIIKRRSENIRKGHYSKKDNADKIYHVIGSKVSYWWETANNETKEHILNSLWEGQKEWRKKLSEEEKKAIYNRSLGEWHKNSTFEQLSNRNRKARLNISPESRERRKKKLQALHKTGKYDHTWAKMSEERKGHNNPAAKKVEIEGTIYLCIKDACEDLNLTRAIVSNRLKSEKYPAWKKL